MDPARFVARFVPGWVGAVQLSRLGDRMCDGVSARRLVAAADGWLSLSATYLPSDISKLQRRQGQVVVLTRDSDFVTLLDFVMIFPPLAIAVS